MILVRKKVFLMVVGVIITAFVSSVAFAQELSCEARDGGCNAGETELFSIYDYTNSHVGSPGYFGKSMCCNQTRHEGVGMGASVKDNSTPGEAGEDWEGAVFSMFQEDNAHVEQAELDSYSRVLYASPYVNCTLRDTSSADENCSVHGEECVISLAMNTSNSHVEECSGDNYVYDLCCEVPEPDLDKDICKRHNGWNGRGYEWNDSWAEYSSTGANPSCCGDENNELVTTRDCDAGVCSDDPSDWACCDDSTDCVYNRRCFEQCDESDVNSDGHDETCFSGQWKLGKEVGEIFVDGDVLGWDTADRIPDADVTVKLIHDLETLDVETDKTDSDGSFRLKVNATMRRGEMYRIEVTTRKGGESSYVEKRFIFHGGGEEYLEVC